MEDLAASGDSTVLRVCDSVTQRMQDSCGAFPRFPASGSQAWEPPCKVSALVACIPRDTPNAAGAFPVLAPQLVDNRLLNKWHSDERGGGEQGLHKLVFSI